MLAGTSAAFSQEAPNEGDDFDVNEAYINIILERVDAVCEDSETADEFEKCGKRVLKQAKNATKSLLGKKFLKSGISQDIKEALQSLVEEFDSSDPDDSESDLPPGGDGPA